MVHRKRWKNHNPVHCPRMQIRILTALFGALIFGLSACETSEISPQEIPSGQDYFPIQVGNYWIYKVDSVEYPFTGGKKQGTFFYKEWVSDTLPDQEGGKVYRLEISSTLDTTLGWHLDSVWTVRVDKNRIIKTENNRPLVKLVFPLKEGSRWDGNQFNTDQDSNSVFWYKVQNLNKPMVFNGKEVPSVTINQKIDSSCINFSYFSEVYFKNIGLAYRRKTYYDYSSCIGVPTIEQGRSFEYTLLRYGKE